MRHGAKIGVLKLYTKKDIECTCRKKQKKPVMCITN